MVAIQYSQQLLHQLVVAVEQQVMFLVYQRLPVVQAVAVAVAVDQGLQVMPPVPLVLQTKVLLVATDLF
jgi:hypothetical protein